jgi:hypothetical protein
MIDKYPDTLLDGKDAFEELLMPKIQRFVIAARA